MEDWGSVLISWEKVYQGRKEGGLGVLGIEIHNKAFLMKHIHKFFYHFDLHWVNIIWDSYYSDGPPDDRMVGSFWWKSVLKLMPHFKIVTHCQIGRVKPFCFGVINGMHNLVLTSFLNCTSL